MSVQDDEKFMRRCLDLAAKAEGMTYPNPLVGSVIVYNNNIIGEGYHLRSGEAHAEVNAINSVRDKDLLKKSILYVNLEPCSHYGKTPPCADLIISSGIPRVVAGTIDTSKKVSGAGIRKIRESGAEVTVGILEEECRRMNRRFFMFHEKNRPYITLKWAESADGFLDKARKGDYSVEPNWITGRSERILVHRWRASEQAILAGAGTIRADNPFLNVREWKGNNPMRIIMSGSGNIPENPAAAPALVFTYHPEQVRSHGLKAVKLDKNKNSAVQVTEYLLAEGIQSLFVEGGAEVLKLFISSGLWDEARIFRGNKLFYNGIKAPEIEGRLLSRTIFTSSTLDIVLKDKNND